MNYFLRTIIGLSIIMLAVSVTATSCNKVAGDKSNSNNNSGGGNNGGGSGGGFSCSTASCLELSIPTAANGYAKLVDKTNVVVNAAGLATAITPLSDADDPDRSFADATTLNRNKELFEVKYPGATGSLVLVNRKDITTNSMTLDVAKNPCDESSESGDNTYAESGKHCLTFVNRGGTVGFHSFLGTVFKNPNTTTHARGTMMCFQVFGKRAGGTYVAVDDTVISEESLGQTCDIAVVNNAPNSDATLDAAIEIDNNWVDPSAGSTTEVELYAVGFDISGKTIPHFLHTADNFNLAKLIAGVDNATFKKILEHNKWRDLRFKVKIVKSAEYSGL